MLASLKLTFEELPFLRFKLQSEESRGLELIKANIPEGAKLSPEEIRDKINAFHLDNEELMKVKVADLKPRVHVYKEIPNLLSRGNTASTKKKKLGILEITDLKEFYKVLEQITLERAKLLLDKVNEKIERKEPSHRTRIKDSITKRNGHSLVFGAFKKFSATQFPITNKTLLLARFFGNKIEEIYFGHADIDGNFHSPKSFASYVQLENNQPKSMAYGNFQTNALHSKRGIKINLKASDANPRIEIGSFNNGSPFKETVYITKAGGLEHGYYEQAALGKTEAKGLKKDFMPDGSTIISYIQNQSIDEGLTLSESGCIFKGKLKAEVLEDNGSATLVKKRGLQLSNNPKSFLWIGELEGDVNITEENTLISPNGNTLIGTWKNKKLIEAKISCAQNSLIKSIFIKALDSNNHRNMFVTMHDASTIDINPTKKTAIIEEANGKYLGSVEFNKGDFNSADSFVDAFSQTIYKLKGKYFNKENQLTFEGLWSDNQIHDGEAKNFELNYKGMECLYTGTIKNGEMHGDDIHLVSLDGDFEYKGAMSLSEFNGQGSLKHKNTVKAGFFKDGHVIQDGAKIDT